MQKHKKTITIFSVTLLILLIISGTILSLFIFFLPQVNEIYSDFGAEMPLATKTIINLSSLVKEIPCLIVPLIIIANIVVSLLLTYFLKKIENKLLFAVTILGFVMSLCFMVLMIATLIYMPIYDLARVVG